MAELGADNFGAELRRRRESAGLSLTDFAALTHFTKGYLSKIENGRVRANRGLAEICDRALGAGGELLALVPERPPRRTAGGLAGLPDAPRHFVGRAAELDGLVAALGSADGPRTHVIHGLAGTGKTALALAAAQQAEDGFPDGQLFFDLHGHTAGVTELTGSDCLDRLLRVLEVPGDRIPPDLDGRANLFRDRLRGRRLLLVLDNVRNAQQVLPVLPAEPRCRVLVTSRHRLPALDDAAHLPIGILPEAAAVALFRAVSGADLSPVAVAEIVARCGWLPLAVRIVAARLRHGGWTAAELLDRLSDETTRLPTMDDGERSMAAAFQLSFEHLPDDQRRLFGLLAVHPGLDAEVTAVAALAGLTAAGTDLLLDRLHEAHLVTRQPGGRVVLHDLVRTFAVTYALPLLAAGDRQAAGRRLVEHTVARVAAADTLLEPYRYRPRVDLPATIAGFPDAAAALEWLRAQWPTVVAIAAQAEPERCWQLAYLLRGFFFREKLSEPWVASSTTGLAAARATGNTAAVALILNNLGMAYLDRGDLDAAADCHAQAADAFTAAGNPYGATDALSSLAWVRYYQGDAEQALRDLAVSLEAYRRSHRTRNEAIALRGMALAAAALGLFGDAAGYAERARERAQTPLDLLMAVNCAGWVAYRAGRFAAAAHEYAAAVGLAGREGSPYELARALTGLGNLAAARGDQGAAGEHWRAADEQQVRLDPVLLGEARVRLELAGGQG
jgi:tetratricopeptide (TPR) repeat protein/transcriptional regulator with XRE-family HTH domain